MQIDPNKKKIRGWKKQVNKIERWFDHSKNPNLDRFDSMNEDYVKIRIDPWNRLMQRQPPAWYSRLILSKLIIMYDKWELKYKSLNQPFDLQLWINEPKFIRSQVVCAGVGKTGKQRNNYFRKDESNRQFPYEFWKSDIYDLTKFSFEAYMDENLHFKNLEGLDESDIAELLDNGYQSEHTVISGQPEIMYSKRVGTVWVGRKKKKLVTCCRKSCAN